MSSQPNAWFSSSDAALNDFKLIVCRPNLAVKNYYGSEKALTVRRFTVNFTYQGAVFTRAPVLETNLNPEALS
jgi:hypothetical protein